MDLYEFEREVNELFLEKLNECGYNIVNAEELGLDPRAGYKLYISRGEYDGCGIIACKDSNVRTMNYYGGFEYVSEECVKRFGEWTVYSEEDDRVKSALDIYYNRESEENDE